MFRVVKGNIRTATTYCSLNVSHRHLFAVTLLLYDQIACHLKPFVPDQEE